jgi:hypothetical protein
VCCCCCAGPEFGLRYAANTPAFVGCSGAVAAITAYKAALQPMGLPGVGGLPMPIAVVGFLFCCLYIREAVSCVAELGGAEGVCCVVADSCFGTLLLTAALAPCCRTTLIMLASSVQPGLASWQPSCQWPGDGAGSPGREGGNLLPAWHSKQQQQHPRPGLPANAGH